MDSESDDRFEGPVTVDLLADLQAGRLDDQTAARLRQRARTEPDVAGRLAALDRVRGDVAALGIDSATAPDIPADVTARVGAALRLQTPPSTMAAMSSSRSRHVTAAAGVAAVIAAGAVGTAMLLGGGPGADVASPGSPVTTSHAPTAIPLSDNQIEFLVSQPLDLGRLTDPQRRVSCLSGLGYPTSTPILGARPLAVNGRPGVLLLLPDGGPGRLDAVVVAPNCSSVDTGLLFSTVVDGP